jgi:hypothetical protein
VNCSVRALSRLRVHRALDVAKRRGSRSRIASVYARVMDALEAADLHAVLTQRPV